MTALKPALPDFNGEPVHRTAIKFTGVGTGFTGLDVRPVVMELDDEAHFVVRVKAAESASHFRDKNDQLVRMQRVHAEDMAPIDEASAQKVLAEYADEIKRRKAEVDGQLMLSDEAEAAERESADATADPADVAQDAADRVRAGQ
jgi:hypothetical protein